MAELTQKQRAVALRITSRQLRADEARGCPLDLEGARRWRDRNILQRVRSETGELGAATLRHILAIGAEAWASYDALANGAIYRGDVDEIRVIVIRIFEEEVLSRIGEIAPFLARVSRPEDVSIFLKQHFDNVRDAIGFRLRLLARARVRWQPTLRRPAGGSLAAARIWVHAVHASKAALRSDLRSGAALEFGDVKHHLVLAAAEAAQALRGLDGRLAPQVAPMTDADAIEALLIREAQGVVRALDETIAQRGAR